MLLKFTWPTLNSERPDPCEARQGGDNNSRYNLALRLRAQCPGELRQGSLMNISLYSPHHPSFFGMKGWMCSAMQQKLSPALTIAGLVLYHELLGFFFGSWCLKHDGILEEHVVCDWRVVLFFSNAKCASWECWCLYGQKRCDFRERASLEFLKKPCNRR